MITEPLVSVCIPTYNGGIFLKEALDSIKAQTYLNIEVIISDDRSKDNTKKICEEFKESVNFPVYIYDHEPNGIGSNWNNCINKSNGNYIKFLFQDDILKPTCIEKMLKILIENENIKLVASKRDFINDNLNVADLEIKNWIKKYSNLQYQFEPSNLSTFTLIDNSLFKRDDFFSIPLNKIGEPSVVMFKKEVSEEIGLFKTHLKQNLDYIYWYSILKKYNVAILNESLVYFRIHDNQETNKNRTRIIKDAEFYEEFQFNNLFFYINNRRKLELLYKNFFIIKYLLKFYYKIRD